MFRERVRRRSESRIGTVLRLLLPVIALALVAGASAEPLHFLSESAVDPVRLLPDPPAAGSAETSAELDLILRIQETRSAQQIERARADAGFSLSAFAGVLGEWLTPTNLPLTSQFLKDVEADSRSVCAKARTHFGRKRPMFADSRVKVAIEGQEDACYPSGHATRGTVCATILGELAPARKAQLLDRGRELGWQRVVAGVHYPSDLVAGRVLGQALVQAMFANPEFQKQFASVKAEFDAASKRFGEPAGRK